MSSLLTFLGLALQIGAAPEIAVVVRVGQVSIPLSVESRFDDVRKLLPPAGVRRSKDPHDRMHDAKTLCYFHDEVHGFLMLEFFDSDFGMHTARVSRLSRQPEGCTPLSEPPAVFVGRTQVGIAGPSAPLKGFTVEKLEELWQAKREWWTPDDGRWKRPVPCFYRAVEVEVTASTTTGQQSLTVSNWTEEDTFSSCQAWEQR